MHSYSTPEAADSSKRLEDRPRSARPRRVFSKLLDTSRLRTAQNEGSPADQGAENLSNAALEAQRVELKHATPGASAYLAHCVNTVPSDGFVGDNDALGPAG